MCIKVDVIELVIIKLIHLIYLKIVIVYFQLLKCEYSLRFSVLYHCKWNFFRLQTVGETNCFCYFYITRSNRIRSAEG